MAQANQPTYALGHAENELERLALQAQYWGGVTREVLERAGLAAGMRVLDVGCGAGDVSLVAAELVGAAGSVLGVDRSPEAVQRAGARAQALGLAQARFHVAELDALDPALRFDAVIGRFVLLYLADPVEGLRRLVGRVQPGGAVAFVEMDMVAARSVPAVPEIETALHWLRETFRRAGVALDLAARLWRIFRDAGLPEPGLVVCQKLEPPTSTAGAKLLAETVRSLLPLAERFGVTTRAEVAPDTLAERLHRAAIRDDAAMYTPCIVGAYARVGASSPGA